MPFQREYINKIEDLEFLGKLNRFLNNSSIINIPSNSKFKSISRTELEKMVEILDHSPYIICPISINTPCSVGFELINPLNNEKLLEFSEKNLPDFFTFNDLSKHFMNPKNVYIAKQLGYKLVPDRRQYL